MDYFINFSFILIYLVEKKQPLSQFTPQAISFVWKHLRQNIHPLIIKAILVKKKKSAFLFIDGLIFRMPIARQSKTLR